MSELKPEENENQPEENLEHTLPYNPDDDPDFSHTIERGAVSLDENEPETLPIDNLPPREEKFIGSQAFWLLIALLVGGFFLRILLSNAIHGHPTDINNFKGWSIHAAKNPFRLFYKGVAPEGLGIWCDYPPLYIYVLWGLGKFYQLFDPTFQFWNGTFFTTLIKLPPILADLACVWLTVVILKRFTHVYLALLAGAIIAFHPAVIYESALWGQVDSITFALQLLSIWFVLKQRLDLALFITALNILVKPQGLILLPLLLFIGLYKKDFKQLTIGGIASFGAAFLLSWPFVPLNQIVDWLWSQYVSQGNLYSYSSIQAFNIWAYTGHWKSDVTRAIFDLWQQPAGDPEAVAPFFLQHKTWGLILFSAAYAFALWFFHSRTKNSTEEQAYGSALWHTCALICIAFFLFPTRMHERYLYSGVLFLAGSLALNVRLVWPFVIMSVTFILNLLYELPGVKVDLKFPEIFYRINTGLKADWNLSSDVLIPEAGIKIIITINLLLFAYICYRMVRDPLKTVPLKLVAALEGSLKRLDKIEYMEETATKEELKTEIPQPKPLDRYDIYWLFILMIVTTLPKLYRLGFPAEQVFDEVYHARAGGEYVIGLHPFEWVHPPIAKLLIAVGVWFYDLTAIGWRIMPVIAGSLLIAVLYFLGRFMLPYRWQAILAAFLLTCDGVYFVQSRTAMTNIFATLFQVASLTCLWRYLQFDRYFPKSKKTDWYLLGTSVFIGLALATRWTSLWSFTFVICVLVTSKILPGLDVREFMLKLQIRFIPHPIDGKFLGLFPILIAVIPAIIYLLSYTQYLSLGHSVSEVITMQKGIWDYHSGLDQPHPYYSAWYTWPWLTRPTWYYFHNNGDDTIGGILALGNPAIWWMSIPVCLVILALALTQKKLHLWYLSLAFICMYLPWGLSPRTLNFSHYFFEAVPYACLFIAYFLGKCIDWFGNIGKLITGAYTAVVFGIFVFFFPLFTAYPVSWKFYQLHIWMKSWV